MLLINFAHPITDAQRARIEQLAGRPVGRVIDVKTHLDHTQPFAEQAAALVDAAGLSPADWQTTPLVVNLPSLAPVAALVLADLHGRMGYFPTVLRLRPAANTTPPAFEVAELLPLQLARERARTNR
jgi:hypothetical protein